MGLAAGDLDISLAEAQCLYVECVYKGIYHRYRVIFINVIIEGVRQQGGLLS